MTPSVPTRLSSDLDDLPDRIANALQRQVLDRLGLEARGGTLLTGFAWISDAIAAGRARLLIHAADAAEDGRRKLDGRLFAARGETGIALHAVRAGLSFALCRGKWVDPAIVVKRAAGR